MRISGEDERRQVPGGRTRIAKSAWLRWQPESWPAESWPAERTQDREAMAVDNPPQVPAPPAASARRFLWSPPNGVAIGGEEAEIPREFGSVPSRPLSG
jgi:hypothetical protein